MILFLVNPTYKEVFRVLHKIKGKREEVDILFVDGGSEYKGNGLNIRKSSYFKLLRGDRKTLKDLILDGYFKEYPFSKVIKQAFFVPKLRGDMLYYAYLSRGWGEDAYIEGIEEFTAKARKLKKEVGFLDYWEVEELKISESIVVFWDIEKYSKKQLFAMFNTIALNPRKTFIFITHTEKSEFIEYFSKAQKKLEVVVFREGLSWDKFLGELVDSRWEFLEFCLKGNKKTLICEWDTKSLFQWAVELIKRDVPFGVRGDYKGENIVLSTVKGVWSHYEIGFFGISKRADPMAYLRAFQRVQQRYFSLEDLFLLGYLKSRA